MTLGRVAAPWWALLVLLGALASGCDDDGVQTDPPPPDAMAPDPDVGVPDARPDVRCAEGTRRPCAEEGACSGSTQLCVEGVWAECDEPIERCDGEDNDCDGSVDEGFDGLDTPCERGLGQCARSGRRVCNAAQDAVVCDVEPGEPDIERCSGRDDDCDGRTDEGFEDLDEICVVGVGRCAREGRIACGPDGATVACSAQPRQPSEETCDGTDEDCDGTVDEGFEPVGVACTVGVGICAREGVTVCDPGAQRVRCGAEPGPPIEEQCNGLDDDCDGTADEGFVGLGEPCEAGQGVCTQAGIGVCAPDGSEVRCSAGGGMPSTERCDGLDNDCDGNTDEAFPALGEDCSVGVGACAGEGLRVCSEDGLRLRCDGQVGDPAPELCNGVDDDCDGTSDETFPGLGAGCRTGRGACAVEGRIACTPDGLGSACDAVALPPGPEQCNGLDDDCDGATDEDFPLLGNPCIAGAGACAAAGAYVCDPASGAQRCSASPGEARIERCNGQDDDCDGVTDETFPLLGTPCTDGVGVCAREGVTLCRADGFDTACSVQAGEPAVERCNGQDDDCDGRTDEEYEALGQPCTAGVGVCTREGLSICAEDGAGTRCDVRPGLPVPEACNTLDDDCDGAIDEAFPELGRPCSSGQGACARGGRTICGEGGQTFACDATPGAPSAERCDGVDDDCDGQADEDFGVGTACLVGDGICARPGVVICGPEGSVCDGVPGPPEVETCDGEDDDCDGRTDEDYAQLGTLCRAGVGACQREGAIACTPDEAGTACNAIAGDPVAEICNGADDDCDGTIDEDFGGLGQPCTSGVGACEREGVLICQGEGGEVACSAAAAPPASEACNNIDDDCDGRVDEAFPDLGRPCTSGLGVCAVGGQFICTGDGAGTTCDATPLEAEPETCNGQDDDCDNNVDENFPALGDLCRVGLGACEAVGAFVCNLDGGISCDAAPGAAADEICTIDGAAEDEDCDGTVDEGCGCPIEGCPDGFVCVMGEGCQPEAPPCNPDPREPDDSAFEARSLGLGSHTILNFCEDEVDWLRFGARAGSRYRVAIDGVDPGIAPLVEVLAPDGETLLASDQAGGLRGLPLINPFVAPVDGQYFVRVRNLPGATGTDAAYRLGVFIGCEDDPFEPDQLPAEASLHPADGSAQQRTLCDGEDVIRFTAQAGQQYRLETVDLQGGADTALLVLDPAGEVILASDDNAGRGFGSLVRWEAPADGDYFVVVGEVTGRYGSLRGYSLVIAPDGADACAQDDQCPEGRACFQGACRLLDDCQPDLHEPDDAPADARRVLLGRSSPLDHCDDGEDWVAFQAEGIRRYDLEAFAVEHPAGVGIEVFAEGEDVPIVSAAPGVGRSTVAEWRPPADGLYLVRLYSGDAGSGGARHYRFVARETCLDDDAEPDDRPELAAPAVPGAGALARRLCQPDWFRFEARTPLAYEIEVSDFTDEPDVRIELYGRDAATRLASAGGEGNGRLTRLVWAAPGDGEFYIRVRTLGETYGGNLGYNLQINQLPLSNDCVGACDRRNNLCGRGPVVENGPALGLAHHEVVYRGGEAIPMTRRADELTLFLRPELDTFPVDLPAVIERIPAPGLVHRGVHHVRIHGGAESARKALLAHEAVLDVAPVLYDLRGRPWKLNNQVVLQAEGRSASELRALATRFGLRLDRPLSWLEGAWVARAEPEMDAVRASVALVDAGEVDWAHPDGFGPWGLHAAPNDPLRGFQWHLGRDDGGVIGLAQPGVDVRANRAWDITPGEPDVLAAAFDDGFDPAHPDLRYLPDPGGGPGPWMINAPGNVEGALNQGRGAHGTSVAGLIAGRGDNGLGITGLCQRCATLPMWGAISSSDVELAELFIQARDAGAALVNNSWGAIDGRPPVEDPDGIPGGRALVPLSDVLSTAIESVTREGRGGLGASVVFSAGNGNEPAGDDAFKVADRVIVVAALSDQGVKAGYSDFGQSVWITAPSSGGLTPGIFTTDVTGFRGYSAGGAGGPDYTDNFGGTSAAAPVVSGVIALMISANPALTAGQVKDLLRQTARPIDRFQGRYRDDGEGYLWSPWYGYGVVDAYGAVRAAAIGCQPDNPDRCVPPDPVVCPPEVRALPDRCDGQDDDCDGQVDEDDPMCDRSPLGQCESCAFDGRCGGDCAHLRDEDDPVCLIACADQQGCPEGSLCTDGLCVPERACSPAEAERCNGQDDDRDGQVDEAACPRVEPGGGCEADAACVDDGRCVGGRCRPTCGPGVLCPGPGDVCMERVDLYGRSTGIYVCLPVFGVSSDCMSECYDLQVFNPLGPQEVNLCVQGANSCGVADACFE